MSNYITDLHTSVLIEKYKEHLGTTVYIGEEAQQWKQEALVAERELQARGYYLRSLRRKLKAEVAIEREQALQALMVEENEELTF